MRRIAANPIPYWGPRGKSREVFEEAFADFAAIGYTAVKADIPEGMTPPEYLDWIGGFGLAPSVSLFSSALDETVDMDAVLESARFFATAQAQLGLDRAMLSSMSLPARMIEPGIGADFSQDRLDLVIANAARVCEVLLAEGIRPLHHSHVGGVFETEYEITSLLDALGPSLLGIGPDTGHLFVAGIDPAAFIARYADRLGAIHLKDVGSIGEGPYLDRNRSGLLWAEPGRGIIDFDAVIAAIPADYDGDFMIEIDWPTPLGLVQSHRVAYEWAAGTLSR